jgi:Mn2+/Fe2+ NRAMP family transporter
MALIGYENKHAQMDIPSLTTSTSIAFIVAFMGWMPIPIDASIWHSLWSKEKSKQTGKVLTRNDVSIDFNMGYITASVIAVLFFMLGVLVMFGSGLQFSNSSVVFSGQLIDLYAQTLGNWTKPFIAIAAFITMFSTTLTVADAYPRVISEVMALENSGPKSKRGYDVYFISLFAICILSLLIIHFGTSQFKLLVDFAAGLSFLSSPFLAWFNYQLFLKGDIPKEFQLKKSFKIFSILCLVGLIAFSIVYIWSIFLN